MAGVSRRHLITGAGIGLAGLAGLSACTPTSNDPSAISSNDPRISQLESSRPSTGVTQTFKLDCAVSAVDLGGVKLDAWTYNGTAPGPTYRVTAGDLMQIAVTNNLPEDTTVHWHGLRIRNDMDGVPGATQDPIAPGGSFNYSYLIPDPGTYFFHSHVGLQLDRAMAGVIVVADPNDPTQADEDWVVVLDDWVDGTGSTPADEMVQLEKRGSMSGSMMNSINLDYPYYVMNGRVPADPEVLTAKPGQVARIRLVNASADTTYRVALADHVLKVTHKDGVQCEATETDAIVIAMGERYDFEVKLGDGAFNLAAIPEAKQGFARTLIRTSSSAQTPPETQVPAEMSGSILVSSMLKGPAEVSGYDPGDDSAARTVEIALATQMREYKWFINGKTFADADPIMLDEGETVRLQMQNHSHTLHPMHLHGHSFRLAGMNSWHDTILLGEMGAATVQFRANNPGKWAFHCHNIYHAEAGMMTMFNYR